MRKVKMLLCLLTVLAFCTACGSGQDGSQETVSFLKPNTTAYDENNTDSKVAAENEYLQLSYQESTGNFSVTNKADGSVYNSLAANPATPAEKSLFEIYYMDAKGNMATMYSYTDAIARGQFQAEYLDNGLKLSFTLGEVAFQYFCPPALLMETYEEIVGKIESSFDKSRFTQMYFLPDFDKLPDKRASELLAKYPNLKEEPMYVLAQDNIPASQQKDIDKILKAVGYTQEKYEEDMEAAGEEQQNKNPAFNVNVYITLEGKRMQVSIPVSEIGEMNEGKIIQLTMCKNFAAPDLAEKGQFLLPDGTGSLMNFYNGKSDLNPVQIPIYGADRSVPVEERIFSREQAYLPVFGMMFENRAVMGVVSDGEAFAEVRAWPGSDTAHGYVAPTYVVRQSVKSFLGSTSTGAESFTLLQKKLYDGSIAIDYYFFDQTENTLVDLARSYTNTLLGDKEARKGEAAIYLEFIGAVREKRYEGAMTQGELLSFTTVAQVRSMLEELKKEGAGNLVVRLTGFGKGGMDNSGMKGFDLNGKLGSEKELKELITWCEGAGIELYIDEDTQYVYGDKFFDGFSKYDNAAYQITRVYGEDYPYSPATFLRMDFDSPRYILNPASVTEMIQKNSDKLTSLGALGLALREAGNDLNSDFSKTRPSDRQNAKKQTQQAIETASEKQKILLNGANAYVLPYVNHVMRIDINKPRFDIADQAVPFLQMVLGDRIGFSDALVNLSGNSDRFVSGSLGAGAGFSYILTGDSENFLRKTTQAQYYSTQFDVWKSDILEKSALLKERNDKLSGEITSYEILSQNIYKLGYENGGWIIANMSDHDYSYGTDTIESYSCLMGGE